VSSARPAPYLVPNVKVEVGDVVTLCPDLVTLFLLGRDQGRDDEVRLAVTGVPHLGVPGTIVNHYSRAVVLGNAAEVCAVCVGVLVHVGGEEHGGGVRATWNMAREREKDRVGGKELLGCVGWAMWRG
jgi:hypothetical protein